MPETPEKNSKKREGGASFGDLLSQPAEYGRLGFGTTVTSFTFLGAIAIIIVYMTITKDGEEVVAEAGAQGPLAIGSGTHLFNSRQGETSR